MTDYPAYSVLMSVYAKADARELQQSISSMLGQTVPPTEFVIIEDGPLTEKLHACIAAFERANPGLFVIHAYPENKGLWYALQVGVELCSNELIARMDADDLVAPERMQEQLDYFRDHPETDAVGANGYEYIQDTEHPVSYTELPETHQQIVAFSKRRCPMRHPVVTFKKQAVLRSGNYQKMPYFEDYDLWMRMISSGCILYNIQKPLLYMHITPDLYQRRGGREYLKAMLGFWNAALKRHDVNLLQYLMSVVPHAIVCLAPNRVRAWVYQKFLRKGVGQAS